MELELPSLALGMLAVNSQATVRLWIVPNIGWIGLEIQAEHSILHIDPLRHYHCRRILVPDSGIMSFTVFYTHM